MNKARAIVVAFSVILFFGILSARLFQIQISQHENYKFLAERQQYKTESIIAQRGKILDANGEVLAFTKEGLSFFIDKRMLKEKDKLKIAEKFSQVFNKPAAYYLQLIQDGKRNICLEKRVSKSLAMKLKGFIVEGLFSEPENSRIYPYGSLASHILGYVNTGFNGVAGIERVCDEYLCGEDGELLIENDVRGRTVAIDEQSTKYEQDGFNVQLTINKSFQAILEEELKTGIKNLEAKGAVGIIMNPQNGQILAMANMPDYNPQEYNKASDQERKNRLIMDIYEPGSTMKSIVLAALFEEKLTNPDEMINTENGVYKIAGIKLSDEHSYDRLTVKEVLEHSSNIGMAKLSERINGATLYKYLRDFGFGNYTTVELPGEVSGKVLKPSEFSAISKASMSRGYAISVTPLQMASAYSAIINGGKLYKPQLLKQIVDKEGNKIKEVSSQLIRKVISEKSSASIRNMLLGVVENGTGKMAQLKDMTVGGKTGTAKQIINNRYSNEYNSSFVGFFPVENPQILCYILVDAPQKSKYGGSSAAPIFKNVAEKIIGIDNNLSSSKKIIERKENLIDEVFAESTQNEKEILFADVEDSEEIQKPAVNIRKTMPDLSGKSIREAVSLLTNLGVKCKITGTGKIVSQSIPTGAEIKKNMTCLLEGKSTQKIKGLRLN